MKSQVDRPDPRDAGETSAAPGRDRSAPEPSVTEQAVARRMTSGWPLLAVGQRVRWAEYGTADTVRAVSDDGRWVITTRPFSARTTVLYTVVDFAAGVRGKDDRLLGGGYETDEQLQRALAQLVAGEMGVSHRWWVWLRFADTQRDLVTAAQLPALRAFAAGPFPARYNDHNPRQGDVLADLDDDVIGSAR